MGLGDFLAIEPIGGDRRFAFEELCCQLALDEPRTADARYFRKGSGADAGVECFVIRADGSEVAWQAKFFDSFEDSQLAQLSESFGQALTKHPQLVEYVVCIPINLRDARANKRSRSQLERWQEWAKKSALAAKEQGRTVKIDLWSASVLLAKLTVDTPAAIGRRKYFFGELPISSQWLRAKFNETKASLAERYTPADEVELPIFDAVEGVSRSRKLAEQATGWVDRLNGIWVSAIVRNLRNHSEDHPKLGVAFRSLYESLSTAQDAGSAMATDIWLQQADALKDEIHATLIAIRPPKEPGKPHSITWAQRSLFDLLEQVEKVQTHLAEPLFRFVNDDALLVTGAAGAGKSHLLADATESALNRGQPALMLLSSSFAADVPVGRQILDILDLHGIPFEVLLGALNAAAIASRCKAVILIDALNERHGPELWTQEAERFLQQLKPYKNLAVVLSCRTTYLPLVFRSEELLKRLPKLEHVGFSGGGGRYARRYLANRGIEPFGGPTGLQELTSPLFLKACCDALKAQGLSAFPKGSQSLSQLYQLFLGRSYAAIESDLELSNYVAIPKRAAEAFTALVRKSQDGYVALDDANRALESVRPSHGKRNESLLFQFEKEGVLTVEVVKDSSGQSVRRVRFTFERIADLLVAEELLAEHLALSPNLRRPRKGSPLHGLLSSDELRTKAGVLEILAVLLPERHALELPDVVVAGRRTSLAWACRPAFEQSVLLRDQRFVTERTRELALELDGTGLDWLRMMLCFATEPDNQFNAEFLDEKLQLLPMAQRDANWTCPVVQYLGDDDNPVDGLIEWANERGSEANLEVARASLAATALTWFLTSSNRKLRDRATKALGNLLRPRLGLTDGLLRRFRVVDDSYVLERLLAALYGAVLHENDAAVVTSVARSVYANIFEDCRPPVHLLIRDHAAGILEYAERRHPESTRGMDEARFRPPWSSDLTLRYVDEKTLDGFRVRAGASKPPIRDAITRSAGSEWTGDFAKYVIAPSLRNWRATNIEYPKALDALEHTNIWVGKLTQRKKDARAQVALLELLSFSREEQDKTRAKLRASRGERDAPAGMPKLVYSAVSSDDVRSREERFAALCEAVLEHLSEDNKLLFELFTRPLLASGLDRGSGAPAVVPPTVAQRWVVVRAHEFGWTEELLGEVDAQLAYRTTRQVQEQERIGKKYQWIALHELLARMADNLHFGERFSSSPDVYRGAWQTSRRDIDPSMMLRSTLADEGATAAWWSPMRSSVASVQLAEQESWLIGPSDVMNDVAQLQVHDSDGRVWFVLSSSISFSSKHMEESNVSSWSRVSCVIVKAVERERLVEALSKSLQTDPDSLARRELGELHLMEFPWHPSLDAGDGWQSALPREDAEDAPKVLTTTVEYKSETGSYDYSTDGSVRFHLPERWLLKGLELRISETDGYAAVNSAGRVVFQDPSVRSEGPSAGLIARDDFLNFLRRESLAPVWVIAGEKGAYGAGMDAADSFVGRFVHSAIYSIDASGAVVQLNWRDEMERPHLAD